MKKLLPLLFLSFAVTALAADADKTKPTTVTTANGAKFDIAVPSGWAVETFKTNPNLPALPAATSLTTLNKDMILLIWFFAIKKGADDSKAKLEAAFKIAAGQYAEGSVEKKTTIKSLDTKSGTCLFAEFTDASLVGKKPQPRQFAVVGTGMMRSGQTLIVVTLLGDSFTAKSYLAGKDVVTKGIAPHK